MRQKQIKVIVGSVIIVGILLTILISVGSENMTYYFTPTEVLTGLENHVGQTVRVMGLVEKGSIQWIPKETKLVFDIADDSVHKIRVEYQGAKPDMFREGQGVVIEGKINADGLFTAANLFVKHTEEYQVTDHEGKKEDYLKTLDN